MRIKVETHGHQFYSSHEGEVVQWCSTVENFYKGGNLQVPAVLLHVEGRVLLLPLKRDLYWTEIQVLDPEQPQTVEKTR